MRPRLTGSMFPGQSKHNVVPSFRWAFGPPMGMKNRLLPLIDPKWLAHVFRRSACVLSGKGDRLFPTDPFGQGHPLGVVLRFPKLAARMKWVTPRFRRERVQQKSALDRMARRDQLGDSLEV